MNDLNKLIWFVCIGLIYVTSACEKASPPRDYYPDWGTVSILKNGESKNMRISGETYVFNDVRYCKVHLYTRIDWTIVNEEFIEFVILKPETKIGDTLCLSYNNIFHPQPLHCVGTHYSSMIYGDVIGDLYKVIPQEHSYMVLTDWDPENLILSGEFQISYYFAEDEHIHDWMADTIRFTESKFTTQLKALDI